MKPSERLKAEVAEEENDLVAMGIYNKVMREERLERFQEEWLPKFTRLYAPVWNERMGRYVILTPKFGDISFYPKANKVLIHRENLWRKPGLKWMVTNLLSQDAELDVYRSKYRTAHYVERGKFYGYPTCCIIAFCATEVRTLEQCSAADGQGFVPCPKHADEVLSGKIQLTDLITKRKCKHAFPKGESEN